MTTPLWCLLIVAVLPYVMAGVGGYLRFKQLGSIDAQHPRIQATELRGVAARAYAAQLNSWEALALFSTAVIVAHLANADPEASATAAVVFVIARVIYPVFYLANRAPLRTLTFVIGFICCLRLFGLAISA